MPTRSTSWRNSCSIQLNNTGHKWVLRYLKGTLYLGLFMKNKSSLNLTAFSNANWGGNLDDRRSTTSCNIFLGSNPISWNSIKQKLVARSSTEAKYRAHTNVAAELLWFKNLLSKLHIPIQRQPYNSM